MKSFAILAAISMIALSTAAVAASPEPKASFDTQLNQAKASIDAIATAGLQKQNGSFDTQLNQAKAAIDKLAADGLAAQTPKK
jgi:hypothetical protein